MFDARRSLLLTLCVAVTAFLFLSIPVDAHFGAIIPSDDIVSQSDSRTLELSLMFFHPFEGQYMNMVRPARFGVLVQGNEQDLLPSLEEVKVDGLSTWSADYTIKRPGDHLFFVEPEPYFEPAEESFIVHYTKVIVNSMGLEVGWDAELGLETEIIPLTRPYGLWAGNVFQGIVKVNGQPAPHTDVEVEYYNTDGVEAPADAFITQVVRTDAEGIFTYAMPRAGWWGFAALSTAPEKMRHTDGDDYDVEIGAVLWLRTHEMR